MPIDRPSDELKNKTNVKPVGNRFNEATAEDFQEIAAILEQLGISVDDLNNNTSSNPYYGRYTSLDLLQAAHTTATEFAWAIIDQGAGISPQIALWDNTSSIWEISGATTDKIYVANQAALPAPGTENTWYITLDKNELYLWYNSAYLLMTPESASETPAAIKAKYESNPDTNVFTDAEKLKLDGLENGIGTGNIDGGAPDSVYTNNQLISGGTP